MSGGSWPLLIFYFVLIPTKKDSCLSFFQGRCACSDFSFFTTALSDGSVAAPQSFQCFLYFLVLKLYHIYYLISILSLLKRLNVLLFIITHVIILLALLSSIKLGLIITTYIFSSWFFVKTKEILFSFFCNRISS